jgi:hypothetical protein
VRFGLLRFADERVPRWNRRRLIRLENLPTDRRILNLAERLVVAVRIEQAIGVSKNSASHASATNVGSDLLDAA